MIEQITGIGLFRLLKDFGNATLFFHYTFVHYNDLIGIATHQIKIMTDQDHRHLAALLQGFKQF